MTRNFAVTYEIVTYESAENGEADSTGFIAENVSLRDALQDVGGVDACFEADTYPATYPRWFTNYEYGDDYVTGDRESRSLHIPEHVTAASRRRIARLLGVK